MLGLLDALKKKQPEDETITIPYESSPLCSEQNENNGLISFGSNVYGRLGVLDELVDSAPHGLVRVPRLIGTKLDVNSIACGAAHMICCVDGQCYSWGKCHFSQLGQGSEWMNCYSPTLIPQNKYIHNQSDERNNQRNIYVKSVGCGESHSMLITSEGELFTFGCGYSGCLGHGSENHELYPRKVIFEANVDDKINEPMEERSNRIVQATGGKCHTIVLTEEGNIWTFGKNNKGQLGLGLKSVGFSQLKPKQVTYFNGKNKEDQLDDVPSVCASRGGDISGCIMNQRLFLWGDNEDNILGINITNEMGIIHTPTMIDSGISGGFLQVAIGTKHIIALSTTNELFSWGEKGPWLGQTVPTSSSSSLSPSSPITTTSNGSNVLTKSLESIFLYDSHSHITSNEIPIHISCGERHSIVVTAHGSVYTCGSSYMNKLGYRQEGNDESRNSTFYKVVGFSEQDFAIGALAGSNHTSVIISTPPKPPFSPSDQVSPTITSTSMETVTSSSFPLSETGTTVVPSQPIGTISINRFMEEALILEKVTCNEDDDVEHLQAWQLLPTSDMLSSSVPGAIPMKTKPYLSLLKPLIRTSTSTSTSTSRLSPQNWSEIDLEENLFMEDDAMLVPTLVPMKQDSDEDIVPTLQMSRWDISIMYSETWQVPVLYFNVFHVIEANNGSSDESMPLSWKDIEGYMEEGLNKSVHGYQNQSASSLWPVISQEIHPITGVPSYMLHPCHTAERMTLLTSKNESDVHYLSSWINLTGAVIGLHIPPVLYTQIQMMANEIHM